MTAIAWSVLVVAGGAALAVDLRLAARRGPDRLRPAVIATVGWTAAGLLFGLVVAALFGWAETRSYITVFVLEKSLSIDNVAVFAVVLSAFAIGVGQRHRVLTGGIVLALALRVGLIAGGLAVVSGLHGILVAFGVVLVVGGARMALARARVESPPRAVSWLLRRRVRPVAAALVAVGVADLVFAVDSVPAAFAVTRAPYIIVAANVFAVLGLRPMFGLLAAALDRLRYLQRALGLLLVLVGAALCVEPLWAVPEWALLATVLGCLGGGVAFSLAPPRRLLVAAGGAAMLLAGVAMLVLPGPGVVVIVAALALLATEFVWARRMLDRMRARLPARFR